MDIPLVLQIVGAAVAIISLAISATALAVSAWQATTTARHQRLAQEAEAFKQFNERFAEFAANRRSLVGSAADNAPTIHGLYNEYWSLQLDQWEAFKRDVISRETYVSWTFGILDTMRGKHPLPPSWPKQGRSVTRNTPDFRLFCERLFKLSGRYGQENFDATTTIKIRAEIRGALNEALGGADRCLRALGKLENIEPQG